MMAYVIFVIWRYRYFAKKATKAFIVVANVNHSSIIRPVFRYPRIGHRIAQSIGLEGRIGDGNAGDPCHYSLFSFRHRVA